MRRDYLGIINRKLHPSTFFSGLPCVTNSPASYLAHASDPRHDGVVEEVEFLPRLTEKEVDLVVVAHGVSDWLALLDVRRANKDGICLKWHTEGKKKRAEKKPTAEAFIRCFCSGVNLKRGPRSKTGEFGCEPHVRQLIGNFSLRPWLMAAALFWAYLLS